MNFPRPIVIILFSIVLSTVTYGQDPYYTSINKLSGLPSNAVYDLFQDSKGFIWIANNEGLTRYDGFEFKTYINEHQTSRSGNQVEEDKYGRIWYKNFDGYLYYIEHDSMKSLSQNNTIGNADYAIINDRLLVLQKKGIDFYDLASLKVIRSINVDFTAVYSQLHFKDHYFILNADSLYKIPGDGNIQKYRVGVSGIMSGSKNGVVIMQKGNADRYCYEVIGDQVYKKISVPAVTYMHELDYCDGLYWISTPNGVWVYDEDGKNINSNKPFFESKSISSVLKDREGNFWFGTLNEGILFVPDLNAKLVVTPDFIPNILSSVKKKVFIGAKDNAIYEYDIATNDFKRKYRDSPRHEIICFLGDTINNRYSFTSDRFTVADADFAILHRHWASVKDLAIVDKKYYAAATNGSISLIKMRDDVASIFDSLFYSHPITHGGYLSDVISLCRGRAVAYHPGIAAIYSGTSKGLFAITPHAVTEVEYNHKALYTRKLVYFRGKVYVLTPQNKVYVIDRAHAVSPLPLTEEKEQCLNIKHAGDGLYFLTNNGIRKFDMITGSIKALNLHPGVRAEEINDMEVLADKLIFSSERGLIVIDANNIVHDTVSPGLVINNILVNGTSADPSMSFSHRENDIDIYYSILSFNTDKRYQLFYKINDGKWQVNSGATRNLKLASLSPGTYTLSFRLESVNVNGYFAEQTIRFTIRKPIWAEWWFMCGCIMLLAAGGYVYYKWQTSLLKKQNQLTVEKVELEKNLRNSMLTSIRSQMNPHFFYNALNAIQSFMFSDDKRNASTYLVKLSKLTRMILEMSEKESITLDEETEALKLYLELEKMRFSDDFNYELHIDNKVDIELVKIPPMIVQPYVENAVKHGLLHKKGNKYLSISFRRSGENLVIAIDDNGIGRERANGINQLKKEKHSSFSTEANSKRIELLNKGRSKNIGVVYVDKHESHVATGTTVIITIPLT